MPKCEVLIDRALMNYYSNEFPGQIPEFIDIKLDDLEGDLLSVVDMSRAWGHNCTLFEQQQNKATYKVEDA